MTQALTTADPQSLELKRAAKKFDKWSQAYLDKSSKTYGNATQSVLAVYKCKNYNVAGSIASQNLSKLKSSGLVFMENDGKGAEYWLNLAATKAKNGSYEQVVNFMQRLGIMDKDANVPANQNNMQFNFGSELAEAFTQARKERGLPLPTNQPDAPDTSGSAG